MQMILRFAQNDMTVSVKKAGCIKMQPALRLFLSGGNGDVQLVELLLARSPALKNS